jgi:hypothetical protein
LIGAEGAGGHRDGLAARAAGHAERRPGSHAACTLRRSRRHHAEAAAAQARGPRARAPWHDHDGLEISARDAEGNASITRRILVVRR